MEERRIQLIKKMNKLGVSHFNGVNHFTVSIDKLEEIITWLENKSRKDDKNEATRISN